MRNFDRISQKLGLSVTAFDCQPKAVVDMFFYHQCSNNEVGCMSTEMQWTTRNPTYCGVFWLSGQSYTGAVVDRFWLSLLSISHFLFSWWWSTNAVATTCLPPIQGWHQIPSSEGHLDVLHPRPWFGTTLNWMVGKDNPSNTCFTQYFLTDELSIYVQYYTRKTCPG